MRIKFRARTKLAQGALAAAAAGGLAVAGLGTAAPALAAVITVNVPCSTGALSNAISAAVDGDVLRLASNCTYVLTSALPDVTASITIQGSATSTIERSYAGATPDFSLLTVGAGGDLTVTKVNFKNGYATTYGGAIYGEDGPVTVNGGTFTGNYSGEYGGAIYNDDGLTVTGATFTGNSADTYGGAIDNEDTASILNSTFSGNSIRVRRCRLQRRRRDHRELHVQRQRAPRSMAGLSRSAIHHHAEQGLLHQELLGIRRRASRWRAARSTSTPATSSRTLPARRRRHRFNYSG